VRQRKAQRNPNRSRRAVGMISWAGFWVAAQTMIPAARPRATRSRRRAANSAASLRSGPATYRASSSMTTSSRGRPRVGVSLRRRLASSVTSRRSSSAWTSAITLMASVRSGPTERSAMPAQQASSTSLPSNRISLTVGSRAAAASSSANPPDLPAPDSPPSRTWRSGRVMVTQWPSSSTPTGIGCHSEHCPASSHG
jgi:hypothetical protein